MKNNFDKKNDKLTLTEQHQRILTLLKNEPGASQNKILAIESKQHQADENSVKNALQELKKARLVTLTHGYNWYHKDTQTLKGKVQTTERGFAFVTVEGHEAPYFVPASNAKRLMNNDIVSIVTKIKAEGEKPVADVTRLWESTEHMIWGRIKQHPKGYWMLESFGPDATQADIRLVHREFYKEGDVISVAIPANRQDRPFYEFEKATTYLGQSDKPYFIQDLVQKMFELPDFRKFPQYTLQKPTGNKKDYRHIPFVSIDDASTKDIDDAIAIQKTENGTRIYIAIADPTGFVPSGSLLEQEALNRGVTCYLPGKKIPMLPKEISEECASLNEGQETPSMVVVNDYDDNGVLLNSRIEYGMIKNHMKLTYDQVEQLLTHHVPIVPDNIADMLLVGFETIQKIKQHHVEKGELPIQRFDPDFILDPTTGEVVDVTAREENNAQTFVSTCMLEANISVAKKLKTMGWGIYRHHPEPTKEAWQNIKESLEEVMEIENWPEEPSLIYLQSLFTEHSAHYDVLVNSIFESLVAAHYSSTKSSHFSLGVDEYTHFTSPIRRFADFMVHRLLKGEMLKTANLLDVVKTCNDRTIRAAQAEKMARKMLITRFMERNPQKEWTAEFINANKTHVKVYLKEAAIMAFIPRSEMDAFLDVIKEDNKEKVHWKGPLTWKVCCTATIGVDKPLVSSVEHTLCLAESTNGTSIEQ